MLSNPLGSGEIVRNSSSYIILYAYRQAILDTNDNWDFIYGD